VTPDTVHASLLIFPELAKLANSLSPWVSRSALTSVSQFRQHPAIDQPLICRLRQLYQQWLARRIKPGKKGFQFIFCRMISTCAIASGNNGVLVPHSTVAQELRDPFLIHS